MTYVNVIENRMQVKVHLHDIIFVEVRKKICMLHTSKGVVKTYQPIDELEKQLTSAVFIRCHRSFIINMQRVKEMHKDIFILENNERAYISRRLKNFVKKAYGDYIRAGSSALANNAVLSAMKTEYTTLENKLTKTKKRAKNPAFVAEYLQISQRKNELEQNIKDLQKDILAVEVTVSSPRLTQTRFFFEQGEMENAKTSLNLEEMTQEDESEKKMLEKIKQSKSVKTEEYLYLAKMMKTDINNPDRFDIIEKAYTQAIKLEEEYHLDKRTASHAYADYLYYQKDYEKAAKVAQNYLHWLETSRRDEVFIAGACNLIARCYNRMNNYEQSKEMFLKALEIRERLAEGNPAQADLAQTLQGLARIHEMFGNKSEAETLKKRALSIYEDLTRKDAPLYEPMLAKCCNNLSEHYLEIHEFDEAGKYNKRAMEIQKKLAESNPGEYEPHLARTYNDLAYIYNRTAQLSQAETLYKQAIQIREKLAEKNPMAYEPDLVVSLTLLANLYYEMKRYEEDEALQIRALHITEGLATVMPKVYGPRLSVMCNNVAKIYDTKQQYNEAEVLYLKAISLSADFMSYTAAFKRNYGQMLTQTKRYAEAEEMLAQSVAKYKEITETPSPLELDLARCYIAQGDLYKATNRTTQAKDIYTSALTLLEKLAEKNPAMIEPILQQCREKLGGVGVI